MALVEEVAQPLRFAATRADMQAVDFMPTYPTFDQGKVVNGV